MHRAGREGGESRPISDRRGKPPKRTSSRARETPDRTPHAMLFGDVTGFSSLSDEHIPYANALTCSMGGDVTQCVVPASDEQIVRGG